MHPFLCCQETCIDGVLKASLRIVEHAVQPLKRQMEAEPRRGNRMVYRTCFYPWGVLYVSGSHCIFFEKNGRRGRMEHFALVCYDSFKER